MGLLDRVTRRRMNTSTGPGTGAARIPRFAVIDVETTGLSPVDERIIELAIVRADEHGRPIDQWVTRFQPDRPVGATHVHGITDADVAHAPRFADLAVTIGTALQGMVVVGHNAEFDVSFLRAEFARGDADARVLDVLHAAGLAGGRRNNPRGVRASAPRSGHPR